ncbi:MAG TPA: acyl-CoA dehydrogenase family protein [Longimicrobiales bacterium]|nr:acyl-CoA dehydrogenase family protein [Longimicrobiales bacterium]
MNTIAPDLDSSLLRELAGRAREVAQDVVRASVEREDREAAWPAASMKALADAGLMGLLVPTGHGGHGLGMTALAAVSQEIARESPSTALCFAMHCVGTAVIAARPTPAQARDLLEPIARGEHITTLALSEPGSGSQFWLPATRLARTADGYAVHGTKSFVTNGSHADSYVVSTVAADGAGAGDGTFSLVVVDGSAAGLCWQDAWHGLGMRANSSRTVQLQDVHVPADRLLGRPGDQLWYVFEIVAPYFLMAMAGTYLGIAVECVEEARDHLGSRRHAHTGELLGASPLLAHRLGELWIRMDAARQLVYTAARRADAGDPDSLVPVFACKAAASKAAVDIANEAMTLAGGMAYRENSKLARMLRDARASHVMAPTTDQLQVWIGRALLKLPLL